jgi:hypothetical protein
MDYLVNFGDSWAAGDFLKKPKQRAYSTILSKQFKVPMLDFSVGSTSIQHLLIQFQDFMDTRYYPERRYHALFFLTARARTFLYEDNTDKIIHCSPQTAGTGRPQEDAYYKTYNNSLGNFNLNVAVLALQRLCSLYNINDYYMFGWETAPLWKSVDSSKFYANGEWAITKEFYPEHEYKSLQNLIDEKNPYIWTAEHGGHPTDLGHEKIANAIGPMIKISRSDVH